MLAADYKAEFPEEVVGAIAARVQQHPLKGLACLYLLDSIIKNVRDPYPKLFQNVIVPLMRRLTEEVHPHHLCTDSFPAGSFFVVPKAAIHTKNTHISVRRIPFLFFQEDIFIARRCVTLNVLGAARSMRVRAFMGNYNGFTQRCESKCWKTGKRRKKSRLSSKHKKITACICRSSLITQPSMRVPLSRFCFGILLRILRRPFVCPVSFRKRMLLEQSGSGTHGTRSFLQTSSPKLTSLSNSERVGKHRRQLPVAVAIHGSATTNKAVGVHGQRAVHLPGQLISTQSWSCKKPKRHWREAD